MRRWVTLLFSILLVGVAGWAPGCYWGDDSTRTDDVATADEDGKDVAGEPTEPVVLLIDGGNTSCQVGMAPWLHVDGDNDLHVSYTTTHGGDVAKLHVKYATNKGGDWQTEIAAVGGGGTRSSALTYDLHGYPEIAYLGDFNTLAFARKVDGEWEVTQLQEQLADHVSMGTAADPGEVHVFFRKEGARLGHFIRNQGDQWKEYTIDDESVGPEHPSVAVQTGAVSDSVAHLAHIGGLWPGPPYLQYSRFIGEERMKTEMVDEEIGQPAPTAIAVDPNDGIHIVHMANYYFSSTGTSWTKEELPVSSYAPAITTEAAHIPHLCATKSDALWYIYRQEGDDTWHKTLIFDDAPVGSPDGSDCHIALGRGTEFDTVHLVFHADGALYYATFTRYFERK